MKPIYIIGFMGAGKSSVGSLLATLNHLQFIDTDIFLEARFRKSIRDMFVEVGEERFRQREHSVIEELSGMNDTVIATGGGLPCFHNNMALMNETGKTVYLEASDEALFDRLCLCKRTRPAICNLSEEEIREFVHATMLKRRPVYEQAQYRISAEQLMNRDDEVRLAQEIAESLNL